MHQMNIRISDDIYNRLDDLAKKTGRTKTHYVKEAILSQIEDLEDANLALQALEESRKAGNKVYSLEEVEKLLGLDD